MNEQVHPIFRDILNDFAQYRPPTEEELREAERKLLQQAANENNRDELVRAMQNWSAL